MITIGGSSARFNGGAEEKMRINAFRKQDVPEITELWNRNFSKAYQVSEGMLMNKIINDGDLFAAGTLVCTQEDRIVGFIVTKVSDNSLPEYQNTAWLSVLLIDKAYRGTGLGSLLYGKAEEELKKAGIKKLIAGGEMNNFFSGIPDPSAQSRAFFAKLGFQLNSEEHYDLSADVSTLAFDSVSVTINSSEEFVAKPLSAQEIPALKLFLTTEFPGRWDYEIMHYIEDGGDLNQIMLLCREQEVKGFCKVFVSQTDDDFTPRLGSNWGSLGPIGISEDVRGMGLGSRILCDSLKHLKKLHARNVYIDWTVLKDFYGQFGFTPWRIYLGAYKQIKEGSL
jgi:predicted N-acetyltransferase YhbS